MVLRCVVAFQAFVCISVCSGSQAAPAGRAAAARRPPHIVTLEIARGASSDMCVAFRDAFEDLLLDPEQKENPGIQTGLTKRGFVLPPKLAPLPESLVWTDIYQPWGDGGARIVEYVEPFGMREPRIAEYLPHSPNLSQKLATLSAQSSRQEFWPALVRRDESLQVGIQIGADEISWGMHLVWMFGGRVVVTPPTEAMFQRRVALNEVSRDGSVSPACELFFKSSPAVVSVERASDEFFRAYGDVAGGDGQCGGTLHPVANAYQRQRQTFALLGLNAPWRVKLEARDPLRGDVGSYIRSELSLFAAQSIFEGRATDRYAAAALFLENQLANYYVQDLAMNAAEAAATANTVINTSVRAGFSFPGSSESGEIEESESTDSHPSEGEPSIGALLIAFRHSKTRADEDRLFEALSSQLVESPRSQASAFRCSEPLLDYSYAFAESLVLKPRLLARHLDAGGDANMSNTFGKTLLMSAAHFGDEKAIAVLIAHGADTARLTFSDEGAGIFLTMPGRNAFMYAAENGNEKAIAALESASAEICRADGAGNLPAAYLLANRKLTAGTKQKLFDRWAACPGRPAPSFDCAKASNNIDRLTCDSALAAVDQRIVLAYEKLQKTLPAEAFNAVRKQQRDWVKSKHDACRGEFHSYFDLNQCANNMLNKRWLELLTWKPAIIAPARE